MITRTRGLGLRADDDDDGIYGQRYDAAGDPVDGALRVSGEVVGAAFSTVDTIMDFAAAAGDRLLIEGLFDFGMVDRDTTLRIDTSGHGDFAAPDKTIVVQGVDLVDGAGQVETLDTLLAASRLEVAGTVTRGRSAGPGASGIARSVWS